MEHEPYRVSDDPSTTGIYRRTDGSWVYRVMATAFYGGGRIDCRRVARTIQSEAEATAALAALIEALERGDNHLRAIPGTAHPADPRRVVDIASDWVRYCRRVLGDRAATRIVTGLARMVRGKGQWMVTDWVRSVQSGRTVLSGPERGLFFWLERTRGDAQSQGSVRGIVIARQDEDSNHA